MQELKASMKQVCSAWNYSCMVPRIRFIILVVVCASQRRESRASRYLPDALRQEVRTASALSLALQSCVAHMMGWPRLQDALDCIIDNLSLGIESSRAVTGMDVTDHIGGCLAQKC